MSPTAISYVIGKFKGLTQPVIAQWEIAWPHNSVWRCLRARSPVASCGYFPSKNRDFWVTEGNWADLRLIGRIRGSASEPKIAVVRAHHGLE